MDSYGEHFIAQFNSDSTDVEAHVMWLKAAEPLPHGD